MAVYAHGIDDRRLIDAQIKHYAAGGVQKFGQRPKPFPSQMAELLAVGFPHIPHESLVLGRQWKVYLPLPIGRGIRRSTFPPSRALRG
jgi:hypothetical protein